MAFKENYQQPVNIKKMLTAVAVDSQVVNCNRFSYQQVIHILHSLQAPDRVLDFI